MSSHTPQAPPPPPPPPQPTDPTVVAAGRNARMATLRRRGRASTILAGDMPNPELATTTPAAGTGRLNIGD